MNMAPIGPAPRWSIPAVATLAAAVLALLSQDQLGLVDFISFAGRARRLRDGLDLVHPLYPVGYPALLSAVTAVVGDVLHAGKVLSIMGGALAIAATARLVGPLPALWLLAQGALLQWGSVEGTDMPAAALTLACLAAAVERRPLLAGARRCCMLCRYTGVAVCRSRCCWLADPMSSLRPSWRARRPTGSRPSPPAHPCCRIRPRT